MHFDDFAALILCASDPLILVEGRRSIPEPSARRARSVAALLARRFPRLRFRSGNATGADEAFAAGIIATAPERLEIIAPYLHPSPPCSGSTTPTPKLAAPAIPSAPAASQAFPWYSRTTGKFG